MAIKFVDEADLTVVGNAIRAKTGGTGLLTFPAGMAEAVSGIQTAKPEQAKSATPSLSAQTITPDSGKVLSSVSVSAITKELLAQLDADFVANNIKKDVNLFGLIGALQSGIGGGLEIYQTTFTPSEDLATFKISYGKTINPVVKILAPNKDGIVVERNTCGIYVGVKIDELGLNKCYSINANDASYGSINYSSAYGYIHLERLSYSSINASPFSVSTTGQNLGEGMNSDYFKFKAGVSYLFIVIGYSGG